MLFKIGVVFVSALALFVIGSAVYAHISYYLMKNEQRKGL